MSLFVFSSERKLQKNRSIKIPKIIKLSFGEFGLIIIKEGRIELVQLNILKRYMKYFIPKIEGKNYNRNIIWYSLTPNYIIQRKSKNSRMGKGKGLFERRAVRVQKNTILLEFSGIPLYKLILLEQKINKKMSVKVKLYSTKPKTFNLWFKSNKYSWFYNKYIFVD